MSVTRVTNDVTVTSTRIDLTCLLHPPMIATLLLLLLLLLLLKTDAMERVFVFFGGGVYEPSPTCFQGYP